VPAPSLDLRPDRAGRAPRPRPPASALVPPDRPPAVKDTAAGGPGDPGGQSGPSRASTPAPARTFLAGDPDEEAAGRSVAGARAQTSPVEAGGVRHAVLEQPPMTPGAPSGDAGGPAHAGHPLAADPAGATSGSVGHGSVPRVAGEPWRVPRPGQPWPGRRDTGPGSAPPLDAAPVTATGPAAAPSAAALPAVAPSASMPRDRAAGQQPPGSASPLPDAVPSGIPAAAPAPGPGSRRPGAAARLSPHPPAAAPLASTAVEASSPSAAPLPAAQPPGSPAQPPDAPLPAAPLVGLAESSPRHSAADRTLAQLTPAVNPASRPPGSRAEAAARPSAPTLSIETIEVTLLPPSPDPPPARSAQREPPRRLSRGLGRRFGQGQE
jgi:hypothetical protein